ncbi:hypothetical protein LUZ60_002543 [Juncus effusus]|nr:hypothetical protein LUZ60_002543 [Juncus effusus]
MPYLLLVHSSLPAINENSLFLVLRVKLSSMKSLLLSSRFILFSPISISKCASFQALASPHERSINKIQLLHESNPKLFLSDSSNKSALMLHYANNGLFSEAQSLWSEIINSSFVPSIELISNLMESYSKLGKFDEILMILDEIATRNFEISQETHSRAVTCFGNAGKLELMEEIINKMASKGFQIDSFVGNSFVKYYSVHGSILEMEYAYQRLKKSRILIEKDTIRSMALAYITERKYFKLGEFSRDLGLKRLNAGNLIWNLLLLSYAANFKMKSLQREFLNMLDHGFKPDLNTFNIRSLAFSRMGMFWDLHLSLDHMKNENVFPDLVTYGCIIDAYLHRRLARNLNFALDKMGPGRKPVMNTDPLVFEAFGKGDFHASCEILLESCEERKFTYEKLVRIYLKKWHRSNQIFWNY